MANTITTQVVLDGTGNAVIKVVGLLDTSNLASTTIIDPALLGGMDLTGAIKASKFRIEEVEFSIANPLIAVLTWDATTPVPVAYLSDTGELDAECYGGIPNNAAAPGFTGKLLMTTLGWASGSIGFTLLIKIIKVK